MRQRIESLLQKIKELNTDPKQRRSWQGSVGISIVTLFVLSSVLVNRSVQALNQASGNYGYYGGTYGYNATNTSSDYLPKPPTALTSSVTSTTATVSWTAPTQTQGSTTLDNLHATTPYLIHYSTSALSTTACSRGSSTTSTTATVGLTGLTAYTTYYVNICTEDVNSNRSDDIGTTAGILSSTFTTTANSSGASGNPSQT